MKKRHRILLRTVPFLIIGILVFILYLVLFVNIPEMLNVMQQVNLLIYSLAAFILIVETFLFTMTWQYLLLPLSVKIPLKKAFLYVWIGAFADLIIPAESVSGEIIKTYLVSKEPNINLGKVVASLISQRILGTVTTTATLFIGLLTLLALNYSLSDLMLQILIFVTFASAVAFALLVVVCVKEKWTERSVNAVMRFIERVSKGRFRLERFQARIVDALKAFHESMRVYGSKPSKLILPTLLYVATWFSSVAIAFLVFVSIEYVEPNMLILLLQLAIVHTLLTAIKSIPIGVPAEVGLPDIMMTTLFILFGIPADISAAATVLTRILTVWLRFFIGLVAVQWFGVKSLMESGVFDGSKDEV